MSESGAVGFPDEEIDRIGVAVVAVGDPIHAHYVGALDEQVSGSSSLDGACHGLHCGESEYQCGCSFQDVRVSSTNRHILLNPVNHAKAYFYYIA